jgi:SRSO17 transposase
METGFSMTAYGVFCGMTFPLLFEVYKHRERLQPGDKYFTKPEIAAMMMRKLQSMGFKFNLVLADSLDGEQRVGRAMPDLKRLRTRRERVGRILYLY